jgi:WD40 repeat protein
MCVVAAQKTPSIQPEVYQALQGVWLEDEEQKVPILNEKNSFKIPYTYRVALSPTGDTLAVSLFGNVIQLRSKEGKVLRNFPEMTSLIDEPIFSPNGQLLFAKSLEGNCYLWSFKENRLLVDIPAVQGALHRKVFFTTDSKKLALTKGADILLYDVEEGKLITSLNANSSDIIHMSISADGKRLLSSDDQGGWMLWDIEKLELIKQLPGVDVITALSFSPDGQTFVLASNKTINQYASDGTFLTHNGTNFSNVDDIQYSKDGQHLAVLLDYGAILLYSAKLNMVKKFRQITSTEEIFFSKDGNYLWANGYNGTYKINLEGEEIFTVPHTSFLGFNKVSPNENYVLSIDEQTQFKFWEHSPSPILKMTLENNTNDELTLYNPSFGVDDKQFFINALGQLHIWEEGKGWREGFYPEDKILSVASYTKGNNSILTAAFDSILVWRNANGDIKQKLIHPSYLSSAQFFSNNQKIFTTSDSVAYIWSTNGQLLKKFLFPEYIIVSYLLENDYLLTQTENGRVFLNDSEGNLINEWQVEDGENLVLYVAPSLDYFLMLEIDNVLSVCDLKGQITKQIDIKDGGYIGVSFSEDGQCFLLHDIKNEMHFWNRNGKKIWSKNKSEATIFFAKVFRKKNRIVISYGDGVIHILDLNGKLIQEWVGHKDALYNFVYSKDGSKVLTCSSDKTAKLWTKDGQLLADFVGHENRVNDVLFSPDEKWVLTTSADGSAIKWPMPSTYIEWIENLNLPPFTEEEKRFFGID